MVTNPFSYNKVLIFLLIMIGTFLLSTRAAEEKCAPRPTYEEVKDDDVHQKRFILVHRCIEIGHITSHHDRCVATKKSFIYGSDGSTVIAENHTKCAMKCACGIKDGLPQCSQYHIPHCPPGLEWCSGECKCKCKNNCAETAKSSKHNGQDKNRKEGCTAIEIVLPFIGGAVLMILIGVGYIYLKRKGPTETTHSKVTNRIGSVNDTFDDELIPTKVKENYLKQRSISSKELNEISISST